MDGGAIAMYGFSYLSLSKDSHFEFINNTASDQGGGIYYRTINQHDSMTGSFCFLLYDGPDIPVDERNITFIFANNHAKNGGNSIYSETFKTCLCQRKMKAPYSVLDIVSCIGNFTFHENHADDDSNNTFGSAGGHFRIGKMNKHSYRAIPGEELTIEFSVVDEFNTVVQPLMSVSVETNSSIQVNPRYTLTNNIALYGPPHQNTAVSFTITGIVGVYFKFSITMLDCPPGFYLGNPEKQTCLCGSSDSSDQRYTAISKCQSFNASINRNNWAGYIPSSSQSYNNLYFATCFPPLCRNKVLSLPKEPSQLSLVICAKYRTGIMCGKCIRNNSVYFHSRDFTCSTNHLCHFGPLLYFLSEIIPTIVLFTLIVLFDLNFTSGNVVGLIFFFQHLDRLTIPINDTFSNLRTGYRLFYGVFNFEYFTLEGMSFCLWKDLQILDIIAFKYITLITAFTLVIVIVVLIRSRWFGIIFKLRKQISTRTSFVSGLSAFLVICYSGCTKTSLLILKYTVPVGINDTKAHTYSYYGGLLFFQEKHLYYAIPALISLITITALPPLILILYPLSLHILSLCKLSEHWLVNGVVRFTFVNRLIPFIDCFQSCYRDKLRFFAGLYFVYRVSLLCCYILSETEAEYRIYTEILLILFLGIHSVVQPYKERLYNLLDSLVFLNLALINGCTMITDVILDGFDSDKNILSKPLLAINAFQLFLLYLPMMLSLAWLGGKMCKHIKNKCYRNHGYELLDVDIGDQNTRDHETEASLNINQDLSVDEGTNISNMLNYSNY